PDGRENRDSPGFTGKPGLSRFLGLYAMLSRIAVRLPPLRERTPIIGDLALAIATPVATSLGRDGCPFTDGARGLLETYPWPGNMVELEAVVTRSLIARVIATSEMNLALDTPHILLASTTTPSASRISAEPAAETVSTSRRGVVVP